MASSCCIEQAPEALRARPMPLSPFACDRRRASAATISAAQDGRAAQELAQPRTIIAGRQTATPQLPQDGLRCCELAPAFAARCRHCDVLCYGQRQRHDHVARGQRLVRLPIPYDLTDPFDDPGNPLVLEMKLR
jgi:hypothetical protein